jgi:membrane associated rhomboid family serine protease
LPLSDRDYMRPSPPNRGYGRGRMSFNFSLSPLLLIIIANLILYIATLVAGEGQYPFGDFHLLVVDKFTYYLGLIPYYFAERPWTLITAMFIHADFWHFFFNMIVLFFFGRALSNLVGQNKLLLVYFIGGIAGNALYLLLGDSLSIAVGASGAVYAVAGALTMIAPRIRVLLYFIVPVPLWVVVLVFFVIWSFVPGVAWEAHIGGLVVGLIAGYFYRKRGRYYVF